MKKRIIVLIILWCLLFGFDIGLKISVHILRKDYEAEKAYIEDLENHVEPKVIEEWKGEH